MITSSGHGIPLSSAFEALRYTSDSVMFRNEIHIKHLLALPQSNCARHKGVASAADLRAISTAADVDMLL